MTIYTTRTETDSFFTLVTDDFLVLQQLRIQPAPCKCMIRDEDGPWRWIGRLQAQTILSAWVRAAERQQAKLRAAPAARARV